jgi:hypothetical protein
MKMRMMVCWFIGYRKMEEGDLELKSKLQRRRGIPFPSPSFQSTTTTSATHYVSSMIISITSTLKISLLFQSGLDKSRVMKALEMDMEEVVLDELRKDPERGESE